MNKNAIKKYAMWARRELISRVSQRAAFYGITKENSGDSSADSVNGTVFSAAEKKQRQTLIGEIKIKGYEEVMEKVAYTWFNRFSALRFMEVNGYLPTRVRVFTDDNNAFKPQILTEAIHMEMDGLDRERVYAYKEANENDALYRYLLITQCNALSSVLPGMFQRIADYTELLFPDNLLREGSVVEQMIYQIPEEDWRDQVQIIGWLYQYYNSEKKDEVFAALKKNVKITKENIPAAMQLFTPDWIVRYMVENSLGRLWVSGQGSVDQWSVASGQWLVDSEEWSEQERKRIDKEKELAERMGWKYYLPEAEQEPEAEAQLSELRREYAAITPEQIRCVAPCAGSGHIITYLFDVLVQIYEAYGVDTRTAVSSIVENNIYGLDIDERAAQLAYFSLMMKACQYDRRFLRRKVQPHVMPIAQSNHVDPKVVEYFCDGDEQLAEAMQTILKELHDAKEYGSILSVTPQDWERLYERFEKMREEVSVYRDNAFEQLFPLVQTAEALAQKYDVVVTNPPYMGSSGMSGKLSDFVKKNYRESKSDLFAVFIERCGQMTKKNGYQAMIPQHSWMFLSSFEKLRNKILHYDLVNMVHLGARAFEEIGGEVVQTTSFVMRKDYVADYKGEYCRLIEPTTQQGKEDMFLAEENRYTAEQSNFAKIPGSPVAYWVSERTIIAFQKGILSDIADTKQGFATGDNNRFLKFWQEIDWTTLGLGFDSRECAKESSKKWFPTNKGGSYRKWYGNNNFLKDFYKDHCKTYQKRPIYWLFDSGRENGFKCLIYMHRYRSDTIARIRTDYVHEQQARYRTAIEDLENRIAQGSAGESVRLKKQLKMRKDQAAEIHAYEEKIHHLADRMISINLDDGVKHNYAIFQDVLAKIR